MTAAVSDLFRTGCNRGWSLITILYALARLTAVLGLAEMVRGDNDLVYALFL